MPALSFFRSTRIPPPLPVPALAFERDLAAVWASLLDLDESSIGSGDSFFELGGDVSMAGEMFDLVEKTMGPRVSATQLTKTPELAPLSAAIMSAARLTFGHVNRPEVIAAGAPGWAALVCVAALGDTVLGWRRLAAGLDQRLPVIGVESVGFDAEERPLDHVEDIADYHIAALRDVNGDRRVVVCGHSFGGTVAYELARRLRASGHEVVGLLLLDTSAFRKLSREPVTMRTLRTQGRRRVRTERRVIRARIALRARRWGVVRKSDPKSLVRWVLQAQRVSLRRYRPGAFEGPLVLLTVDSIARDRDEHLGWQRLITGSIDLHRLEGDHRMLLGRETVPATAGVVDACLLRMCAPAAGETGTG